MDKDNFESKILQLRYQYISKNQNQNSAIKNYVNKFSWRLAKENKILISFIPFWKATKVF